MTVARFAIFRCRFASAFASAAASFSARLPVFVGFSLFSNGSFGPPMEMSIPCAATIASIEAMPSPP
jgi:hypothetical protein